MISNIGSKRMKLLQFAQKMHMTIYSELPKLTSQIAISILIKEIEGES